MKPARKSSLGTLVLAALLSAVIGGALTSSILLHHRGAKLESEKVTEIERAEKASEDAQRQANRANRAREQAEALVEFILDDLRSDLLPIGRTELLSDAAERAVAYFESLTPDQVTSDTEFHRAKVLVTIGQALSDQGDLETAAQRFRTALEILERLLAENPTNLSWQFELGWTLTEFAIILNQARDFQSAHEANSQALTLMRSLVQSESADADRPNWIYGVAAAHHGLGKASMGLGKRELALTAFADCAATARQVLEIVPDHILALQVLAISLIDAGLVHLQNKNYRQSISLHREAVALVRRLMERDPQTRRWEKELATGLNNIGIALQARGQYEQAAADLREALALRQGLVSWDPRNGEWLVNLANSWHNLAALHAELQEDTEALSAAAEATRCFYRLTAREPDNIGWRRELQASHRSLGSKLIDDGKPEAARTLYRQLLAVAQSLHRRHPDLLAWEDHLLLLHRHWEQAEEACGSAAAARVEIWRSAARVRAKALRRHPESASARRRAARALGKLAAAARAAVDTPLERQAAALAHYLIHSPDATPSASGPVHALARAHGLALAPRDPQQFVAAGSSWRYRDADSVSANWSRADFDDGRWKEGPAPLGYGEGDEATALAYGTDTRSKRITAWFRRTFSLPPKPTPADTLQLGLVCDDGAIVYLNGREIVRHRMPAGPVASDTLASETAREPEEQEMSFFTVPWEAPESLSPSSVLAVEVHQNEARSSDLRFDLSLHASVPIPMPLEGFDLDTAGKPDLLGDLIPEFLREELRGN